MVRFRTCTLGGTTLLPFPDFDSGPRYHIPGLHGTAVSGARVWRVPQSGLPVPHRRPVLLQLAESLWPHLAIPEPRSHGL